MCKPTVSTQAYAGGNEPDWILSAENAIRSVFTFLPWCLVPEGRIHSLSARSFPQQCSSKLDVSFVDGFPDN